jgi:hypothetical protein
MHAPTLLLAALLAAAPIAASAVPTGKICLDPKYSYQAHALGPRGEVVAKSTFGSDHRELRLSTTCINLSSAFRISLSTEFNCIDKGDSVFTTTIDGERQSCRITNVQPYVADAPTHS